MSSRYIFADLLTNEILAEIPLNEVSSQDSLNVSGNFSSTILLGDISLKDLNVKANTRPTKTAVYFDRNDTLLWGGIIWTRNYDSLTKKLVIGGNDFLSYFDHRRILDDLTYTNVDQLTIVRNLIDYAQSKSFGNIGVIHNISSSPVDRTISYKAAERKPIGEAIAELAKLASGFDYSIEVSYVAGIPTKTLVLSYPYQGRSIGNSKLSFEYPGNVLSYQPFEDGTSVGNPMYTTGGNDGAGNPLLASAQDDNKFAQGYPRLDGYTSYTDITDQTALDQHAAADLLYAKNVVTIYQIDVSVKDPQLGTYRVGDFSRLRIHDEYNEDLLDIDTRIVQQKITNNGGIETVQLTLNEAS